jgi:alpha-glucosidase
MSLGTTIASILVFLSFVTAAQTTGYSRKGNELSFTLPQKQLKIGFCTPGMFRVRTSWNHQYEANENWMVVQYEFAPVTLNVADKKDYYLLQTSELSVKVYKSSLKIDVLSKSGQLLSAESGKGKSGSYQKGDTVGCTKQLSTDEHFFGFGERMDFLDRRGKQLRLDVGRGKGLPHIIGAYNILEANYSPIPFFMSTNGYGIFFHNAFPTNWDMGYSQKDQYSFGAEGGELDYYFINGPKFRNILDQYTTLTGKAPMMPLFGYGLHMGTYSGGTWGYEQFATDQYVIELARKLRAMGVPVDILWLDSTWRIFGEVGGKGATSFEWREGFKDPKGMFDSVYAMHFKMVGLHLRPRFDNGKNIKLLDTAQRLKYTYPEKDNPGEFVNFFDSSAVDFWWQHGVQRVGIQGARFLKTDEGSAFGALANESEKLGPQGKDIARLHNLFPLAYAKAPYEHFQQFNGIRGLNQTREGYAGIQRYPYIFAGDWPSEWQYFAPVIKAGLNIGLSGVGNWAHCMGGFEHPADPELYIRWVQFGMFSPVSLVFGMDHPGYKEPWNYGPDALRNFRKYDSLRYRLLPYIYSHAFEMNQTGLPLMRALVLDYQDDENVYEIGDQYLFGNNLMVCPVTTKGAQTRTVYLPEGDWFEYWTGKKWKGRQYIHVVAPLDSMPLFVKAGSIIPMQPAMSYVGEKPVDQMTLDVYPGGAATFRLYEDDGQSLDYKNDKYSITNYNLLEEDNDLHIHLEKPTGNFIPEEHHYSIQLHLANKPTRVRENGQLLKEAETGVSWNYDPSRNILFIRTQHSNREAIDLVIR